jgi:hypothetical protein
VLYGGNQNPALNESSYVAGQDVFTIPGLSAFSPTNMTVMFWIKPINDSPQHGYVVSRDRDSESFGSFRQWAVFYENTGNGISAIRVELHLLNQGKTNLIHSGLVSCDSKSWNHVCAQWDGSNLSVYINGRFVRSAAATGVFRESFEPLRVGGNNGFVHNFFGLVNNVMVYDRALSVGDIVERYNSQRLPDTVIVSAPLATTVAVGGTVKLAVVATNPVATVRLAYQWPRTACRWRARPARNSTSASWNRRRSANTR